MSIICLIYNILCVKCKKSKGNQTDNKKEEVHEMVRRKGNLKYCICSCGNGDDQKGIKNEKT